MRVAILILIFLSLFAIPKGPASADPFPNETVAVALNRNQEMVSVKGGCYKMGSDGAQSAQDERPVHEVCVKDFLIATYLVTQAQWISVMGKNPSAHMNCGEACPVENVSWNDTQEFLR